AKAGIAIGSILGAALIGGLVAWLCIMRRQLQAQKQPPEAAEASSNEKPELMGHPIAGNTVPPGMADHELEGNPQHEMYVESQRPEVEGSSHYIPVRSELP
ncbi:hypothetical protein V491_08180, partial [Pseudogymnoascus sp. VKM F-3775]